MFACMLQLLIIIYNYSHIDYEYYYVQNKNIIIFMIASE